MEQPVHEMREGMMNEPFIREEAGHIRLPAERVR
jgi:hypothetical protein